jgi:hypothetical protein
MACRELLLTLNRKGLITLPPRVTSANNEKCNRSIPVVEIDQTPLKENLAELQPVKLKLVRNTSLSYINLATSTLKFFLIMFSLRKSLLIKSPRLFKKLPSITSTGNSDQKVKGSPQK